MLWLIYERLAVVVFILGLSGGLTLVYKAQKQDAALAQSQQRPLKFTVTVPEHEILVTYAPPMCAVPY